MSERAGERVYRVHDAHGNEQFLTEDEYRNLDAIERDGPIDLDTHQVEAAERFFDDTDEDEQTDNTDSADS